MSDFLTKPDKKAIGKLNFRHELIPVRVQDPAEIELPPAGRICFRDPETGELFEGDLSSAELRRAHARAMQAHSASWRQIFHQLGIDALELLTTDPFIPALRKLFHRRSRAIVR